MNMNMNHNAKDQVLSLLRNYRATKRKIEQLRYELEHPARVTPDEMIEAMNFAKGMARVGLPAACPTRRFTSP